MFFYRGHVRGLNTKLVKKVSKKKQFYEKQGNEK